MMLAGKGTTATTCAPAGPGLLQASPRAASYNNTELWSKIATVANTSACAGPGLLQASPRAARLQQHRAVEQDCGVPEGPRQHPGAGVHVRGGHAG